MLTLTNDHLTVDVEPRRGGEIRAVRDRDGRNALGYYDWAAPASAGPGHTYGSSELDWLSAYRGGWQETVPNAGDESRLDGAFQGIVLPFHGEASVLEWTVTEATATSCELTVALRLPLVVRRRMTLHPDRPTLLVEGTIVNESDVEVPFVWGHHPVFPIVPGTRLEAGDGDYTTEPREAGDVASARGRWPDAVDHDSAAVDLADAPTRPTMRLLYLHGHRQNWVVVRQPAGLPSVAMAWDLRAFPATWVWQMRGEQGFPWFGRMAVMGVEPQTAWPYDGLAGAVERGQAHRLGPRQSMSSWLTMTVLDDPSGEVLDVTRDGRVVGRDHEAEEAQ